MINFVIYEDEKYYVDLYEKTIHKFMGLNNEQYKIYVFNEYNSKITDHIKNLSGHNIFIMDIEVRGKSGLDLARDIRNIRNNTNDQIIIVTSHTDLITNAYHKKILMLDFLSKFDDLEENLIQCFNHIYVFFHKSMVLTIKIDGEILRIPYNDILYIEKDKSDNYIYVHTQTDKFRYKSNIIDLVKMLENDMRFFRSHRSAIVNINKITMVDMTNLVIYFETKQTGYLARDKKKELENRMKIIGGMHEFLD